MRRLCRRPTSPSSQVIRLQVIRLQVLRTPSRNSPSLRRSILRRHRLRPHPKRLLRNQNPEVAWRIRRKQLTSFLQTAWFSDDLPHPASDAYARLPRLVSGLGVRHARASQAHGLRDLLGLSNQMRDKDRVRRPTIPAPARPPFRERQRNQRRTGRLGVRSGVHIQVKLCSIVGHRGDSFSAELLHFGTFRPLLQSPSQRSCRCGLFCS
jgi:hypothetical protein